MYVLFRIYFRSPTFSALNDILIWNMILISIDETVRFYVLCFMFYILCFHSFYSRSSSHQETIFICVEIIILFALKLTFRRYLSDMSDVVIQLISVHFMNKMNLFNNKKWYAVYKNTFLFIKHKIVSGFIKFNNSITLNYAYKIYKYDRVRQTFINKIYKTIDA